MPKGKPKYRNQRFGISVCIDTPKIIRMNEIVSWLDDLPSGSQILTPDWWVFDKSTDGTWVFHFFPEVAVSPIELTAHGQPEPVAPDKWNGEAGCPPDCPPGMFAYADPRKELRRFR